LVDKRALTMVVGTVVNLAEMSVSEMVNWSAGLRAAQTEIRSVASKGEKKVGSKVESMDGSMEYGMVAKRVASMGSLWAEKWGAK